MGYISHQNMELSSARVRTSAHTMSIPELSLGSSSGGRSIPVLGMGMGILPFDSRQLGPMKLGVLHAIKLGYRHFDTAALYQSEQAVGDAVAEALQTGLIQSRDELFITSKLWCTDAETSLVVPALRESLRKLNLDYLDLYLIHWPMRLRPGALHRPLKAEDILPFELGPVWGAMEECHRLGLAKFIGVSNFTPKKLVELLQIAKIPPAVNQVEMNPAWQQRETREFCKERGIHVTAFSPLGGQNLAAGKNMVTESKVLQDIAKERGKSVAQVCLRWIYEQGVSMVTKTLNKERMEENMKIFDWELTKEDINKIIQIPQRKRFSLSTMLHPQQSSSNLLNDIKGIVDDIV